MKLSQHWLEKFVNLSSLSTAELENAFTLIGFEVEGMQHYGMPELENVQVGKVLSYQKHPNAEKLRLCSVQTGPDEEPREIVCGADNFHEGDFVVVALPGARLPTSDGGRFKIKRSKIRGQASEGMICSAAELGLEEKSEGILVLDDPSTFVVGMPLHQIQSDKDTVYDIEVTPNRPDCLSHMGIARELAAYFDHPFRAPAPPSPTAESATPLLEKIEVNTPVCSLYYAWSISGVTVQASPNWLQKALTRAGLRPVNNIVDLTNFILLEYGQPLHAFDADKIRGKQLNVRDARPGETIETLDGKTRELNEGMAVIADSEHPLVIAGIMGSIDAEVDENTKNVILEAARFRPDDIRRTSRQLALSTDSSYRFERGIDSHVTEEAGQRCLEWILKEAGGTLSETCLKHGVSEDRPSPILFDPQLIERYCGFSPDTGEIAGILKRLELAIEPEDEQQWKVTPPTFRHDLSRPVDLVEEFLRIYGTDKIPSVRIHAPGLHRADAKAYRKLQEATHHLKANGFVECVHYSLRDERETERWYGEEAEKALRLSNPLASDQSHLRASLIPGLLDAYRHNSSHGNDVRQLFETGRAYQLRPTDDGDLWEVQAIAWLMLPRPQIRQWLKREPKDIFHCKSLAEELMSGLGLGAQQRIYEPICEQSAWEMRYAAHTGDLTHEGYEIKIGAVRLDRLKDWSIRTPLLAGEILINPEIFNRQTVRPVFQHYSLYPPTIRDLALLVDRWEPADSVRDAVEGIARQSCPKNIQIDRVDLFDLYEGDNLSEGKKSLALVLTFRAPDRSLKDKEVNQLFDTIQKRIKEEGQYTIRDH